MISSARTSARFPLARRPALVFPSPAAPPSISSRGRGEGLFPSRNFQSGQPIKNTLSLRNERAHLAGLRLMQQGFQIRTRDKNRFFGRQDYDAFERIFLFDEIELLIEIAQGRGIENIGTRFRSIE